MNAHFTFFPGDFWQGDPKGNGDAAMQQKTPILHNDIKIKEVSVFGGRNSIFSMVIGNNRFCVDVMTQNLLLTKKDEKIAAEGSDASYSHSFE